MMATACVLAAMVQGRTLNADATELRRAIDSNGEFSLDDFRSKYETRFHRLDIDQDGFLSKSEYLFLNRYPRVEKLESSEEDTDAEEHADLDGLPPEIQTQLEIAKIEFEIFDQNKDDRLNKAEMMAPIDQASLLDTNKDGKLDQREMEAILEQISDQSESQQRKR